MPYWFFLTFSLKRAILQIFGLMALRFHFGLSRRFEPLVYCSGTTHGRLLMGVQYEIGSVRKELWSSWCHFVP
jgi:hypothetical protein